MSYFPEYLFFDPLPVVIRRKNVAGGLGKRDLMLGQYMTEMLVFMHRVIGRYHTPRFVSLYFVYLLAAIVRTAKWSKSDSHLPGNEQSWPGALIRAPRVFPDSWLRAVGKTIRSVRPPVPTL